MPEGEEGAADIDVLEIDFDHGSPEVIADRPTAFREIRDRCPVAHTKAHGGFYVLADWDTVHRAAANATVFSSRPRALIPMYPEAMGMLDLDPPQGPQVRRRLNPLFDRSAAEATRARTQELVDQRIDRFIERGSCDLIRELTGPVPAAMTAEGLGLPVERADEYASVFHDLLSGPETEQKLADVLDRLGVLLDEIREVIDQRAENLADDWLSALLTLRVDGEPMPREIVLQNAHLLFSGGVDTTSGAVSWALVHLHRDHPLRDRLRADPSLVPGALEEFLRYYPPFVASARTITEDTELAGVPLKAGRRALLTWAAGNRDPEVFDSPDRFIADRTPNRHLSFGHGNHKCLGQHFARLQMEVIISTVIRRLPDYRIDESRISRYQGPIVDGIKELPITFTPGKRL
ncbi:MAG TPA: cytochrome P450 [Pseudonocardia sp.]